MCGTHVLCRRSLGLAALYIFIVILVFVIIILALAVIIIIVIVFIAIIIKCVGQYERCLLPLLYKTGGSTQHSTFRVL